MEFRLDARLSASCARLSHASKHDAGWQSLIYFVTGCDHQHRALHLRFSLREFATDIFPGMKFFGFSAPSFTVLSFPAITSFYDKYLYLSILLWQLCPLYNVGNDVVNNNGVISNLKNHH